VFSRAFLISSPVVVLFYFFIYFCLLSLSTLVFFLVVFSPGCILHKLPCAGWGGCDLCFISFFNHYPLSGVLPHSGWVWVVYAFFCWGFGVGGWLGTWGHGVLVGVGFFLLGFFFVIQVCGWRT